MFFSYNNIRGLSKYLADTYKARLQAFYQNEQQNQQNTISTSGQAATKETVPLTKPSLNEKFSVKNNQLNIASEPIAIVGMSGTYPRANDLKTFWQNLVNNVDTITEVPKTRWDWQAIYGDGAGKTKAKWGAFIDEVDKFDPSFFGIAPREASLMDPQQRLLLQAVWQAVEDAGYTKDNLADKPVSVYVAINTQDYLYRLQAEHKDTEPGFSIAHSMAANRISYWLNLKGPSEPVDTACSSSIVAVHKAIQSIRYEGCEMAIVAGVSLILSPQITLASDKMGLLTHNKEVKSFDAAADGYIRGEGVGAVILKPLHQAVADGDHIHALIKGSAVNHSGQGQSLGSPSPSAQTKVIAAALEQAGCSKQGVDYIEAHATSTRLGDAIEIAAFKQALAGTDMQEGLCKIGALKPNIAYLEAASGMAALAKIVLSMQHKTKLGVKGFRQLNPEIQLENTPLYITAEHEPWAEQRDAAGKSQPRTAAINSFGMGGVNACIVLEDYRLRE